MDALLKQQPDKIDNARKVDNNIGSLLSDIALLVAKEDYKRATQAAGHLLVALAFKSGTKPFSALRSVYKAS